MVNIEFYDTTSANVTKNVTINQKINSRFINITQSGCNVIYKCDFMDINRQKC